MSEKIKKQYGVWINSNHAIIVGRENEGDGKFIILGKESNGGEQSNSNENAGNNSKHDAQIKLFKDITSHMQNVDDLHITGTGVAQEQFKHYLAEAPQYKNTTTVLSTSNEMSNDSLVEFIASKFQ